MEDKDAGDSHQGGYEQKSQRCEAENDRRENDAYGSFHEVPV